MVEAQDHVLMVGYPNTGKSTLASQYWPEYLVIDTDVRWSEQSSNVLGKYHLVQTSKPHEILAQMEEMRKTLKGRIGTVILDSGTSLMDPLQAAGRLRVESGEAKFNLNMVHKQKADVMRALRGAMLSFHCHTIWIFHVEKHALSGESSERRTITSTEQERLLASLNIAVTVFEHTDKRRGVRIDWTRFNNNVAKGQIVWDFDGMWRNTPARLGQFVRHYTPDCGYAGRCYNSKWLFDFLASKEVKFEDIDAMKKALGISVEPMWFDRNGWAKYVEAAGVK